MAVLDILIGLFRIERQDETRGVIFAVLVEFRSYREDFYLLEAAYNRTLGDAFLLLIAYFDPLWLKTNTDGLLVIDTLNGRQFEYIFPPPFRFPLMVSRSNLHSCLDLRMRLGLPTHQQVLYSCEAICAFFDMIFLAYLYNLTRLDGISCQSSRFHTR